MKVVGYDTGNLTGIGQWMPSDDPLGTIWSVHLERPAAEDHMRTTIPHADVVLIEKLTINAQSHKKTQELVPAMEMAGVALHYARLYDKPVFRYSPGEVMSFATDAKLKRIGWYVKGPDHQRDVRRHILVYVLNHGLVDPSTVLPPEGGN